MRCRARWVQIIGHGIRRTRLVRSALIIASISLMVCFGPALAKERRAALVLGNGAYLDVPSLKNPANDAKAVAGALSRLGFDVVLGTDLDYQGMVRKLQAFGKAAEGAEIAVIFYAGHALQVGGRNYLIPVSARIDREQSLRWEAIPADGLLDEASGAKSLRILILDACRDNPFERRLASSMGTRGINVGRGLAAIDAQPGTSTLIAFSTRAGDTASDGSGAHSPFTTALLDYLEAPDLEIRLLFGNVRDRVLAATKGKQDPWINGSLGGTPFYLRTTGASRSSAPATTSDREAVFWQTILRSNRPEDYQAYLEAFPNGTFVSLARTRLATVSAPSSQTGAAGEEAGWPINEKREVQRALKALGFFEGDADGGFGSGTRTAIKQFQAFANRPQTGVLSNEERQVLIGAAQRLAALLDQPTTSPAGVSAGSIKGAEQRYARAWSWEIGNTGKADPQEAAYWYALSARDGNARALINLGTMTARGRVTGQSDVGNAVLLWESAAARGEAIAMFNLGALYENGIGLPADLAQARIWYERAATLKHAEAIAALKRVGVQ
jgi:uncharacterized caspase-like protein/TPR repeat protein